MWKYRHTALASVLFAASLFSSCAYMQTNKSVGEIGVHYIGTELKTDGLRLFSSGNDWYIGSPKATLKRHYPVLFDTIYSTEEKSAPTESAVSIDPNSMLYLPVSRGTADVLQREDGYCDLQALIAEIKDDGLPVLDNLSQAKEHKILATIESKSDAPVCYIQSRQPEQASGAVRVLSAIDKYTLDPIGTLCYNIAIPFMAPIYFFVKFAKED